MKNEIYYQNKYANIIGPVRDAIHRACINNSFSEVYELAALANVLQLEVHSVYPYIDYRAEMKNMNTVYKSMEHLTDNHGRILLFWTSDADEISTRLRPGNRGVWGPNHFVPLVCPNPTSQKVRCDIKRKHS